MPSWEKKQAPSRIRVPPSQRQCQPADAGRARASSQGTARKIRGPRQAGRENSLAAKPDNTLQSQACREQRHARRQV